MRKLSKIFQDTLKFLRPVTRNNISKISTYNILTNKKILTTNFYINKYSNFTTQSPDFQVVDSVTFEKVSEETLESLTEYFEEIIDKADNLNVGDVSYSGGVLTVNLGDKYGTYVINRQSPNRQIWLSSPVSGPKRYDFIPDPGYWVYKHDSKTLHELLQSEISKIVQNKVDFSICSYSKL